MDWDTYLAILSLADQEHAKRIASEFGIEAAKLRVHYYPVTSPHELEDMLRKNRDKVRTRIQDLYESIDISKCPNGWSITNNIQTEPDGTRLVHSDVIGPNGATGFFERGYNADQNRIELRNAFLRHRGMTHELPGWVTGIAVPMVPARGTPTVQYFTLYQLKMLRVPAGAIWWMWQLLHWMRLRPGPFAVPGLATSIKMSTIQNVETILHLHWLRKHHPTSSLSALVTHTASVDYADTTAVQSGYQVAGTKYVAAGEWESEIQILLDHFEDGNAQRAAEHDRLLSRFSFGRHEIMKQNFNIELSVVLNRRR